MQALLDQYPVHIEENEMSGQVGFILSQLAKFENPIVDFGSGEMLAHDLIEHTNGIDAIGTLHDELTALGAMVATRVETGLLDAEKFKGMYYDLFQWFKENPEPIKVIQNPLLNESIDITYLTQLVSEGVNAIDTDYGLVTTEKDKALLAQFKRAALILAEQGYDALIARFSHSETPQQAAAQLFINIQSAVQAMAHHVDDENVFDGFTLSLNGDVAALHLAAS